MDNVTGGDLVVAALAAARVEVVFGIPSVHNLPVYDALRRDGRIRAITVRHEQSAAGAADGYSRVTGRLGVCITSTGPGAANAMGALVEAQDSGTPVLHLTGQIDSRYLGQGRGFIHEVPDQSGMLASVCKWHALARKTEEIPRLVGDAVAHAMSHPRGPVSLEIPIDLQYAETEHALDGAGTDRPPTVPKTKPESARHEDLEAALRAIRAARRPLIWAGGGVVAADAAGELAELAHRLGAGVITSPNGRGVLPEDDPLCIGNLPWDDDVRSLCGDADLMLAVGTTFRGPNTQNWRMHIPENLVHVDIDPAVPGRCYPARVRVIGDAKEVLSTLLEDLRPGAKDERETDGDWPSRVADAARMARMTLRATLGPQEGLLDVTAQALPPGTVVVKDSTVPAYTWANRLLKVGGVRESVMPNCFAIGLGIPHVLGAAAASPGRPTVLVVGDGGFMLAPGELATFVAERLPVVVLLFDDGGYGILRNIQDRQYGARIGVDLGHPDYCSLARSMGVAAERAVSVEEYRIALEAAMRAAEAGEPRLVSVDLDAIGPMASPYVGTSRPPEAR